MKFMQETLFFDLSAHTKIELAGPEASSFLHNLCSNDVKNLAEGAGCEAFLTTAKARVVAHIFVGHFRQGDQGVLLLDTVPGQAETLAKHLNHYLISEQVEVFDRTQELALFRIVGASAQSTLEKLLGCSLSGLKHLHNQAVAFGSDAKGFVRRFDGLSLPGFDIICAKTETSWIEKLNLPFDNLEIHEILRVEGGLPVFGRDIDENRLVMEVNRVPQAICYTKGCYLGQEPIVMARDRGQVNRLLLGVKTATGAAFAHGNRLFKDGAEVGQVTSSVHSPRLNQVIALAYLKRGFQAPGSELIVEPESDGRTAEVAALPFVS
jgi:tRNA-modifying protein YgfZ